MASTSRVVRSLSGVLSHRCLSSSTSLTTNTRVWQSNKFLRHLATSSSQSSSSSSSTSRNVPVSWVLTTAGPDKSGIVHKLASLVHEELSANIEESRMARLGSDFAVILHLSVPADVDEARLKFSVQSAFPEFLVAARRTSPVTTPSTAREYHVMCEGPDQQGVVQALTAAFVKHGANIRDLSTDVHSAAFAGYPVFELRCLISVPNSVDETELRKAVNEFAESTGFDVWIESADESETEGEGETEGEHEEEPRR